MYKSQKLFKISATDTLNYLISYCPFLLDMNLNSVYLHGFYNVQDVNRSLAILYLHMFSSTIFININIPK